MYSWYLHPALIRSKFRNPYSLIHVVRALFWIARKRTVHKCSSVATQNRAKTLQILNNLGHQQYFEYGLQRRFVSVNQVFNALF